MTATAPSKSYQRALARAGWFYALIPVLGAGLWLLTGNLEDLRNRSPIELTQLAELAILFIAIKAGLGRDYIVGGMSSAQKVALAVVGICYVVGLATAAPDPLSAFIRMGIRVPHLGAAIGLCYLLARVSGAEAGRFSRFILYQALIYIPLLVVLYWLYIDEPRMNWLGGPLGYWHVRVWSMLLVAAIATAIGLHAGEPQTSRSRDLVLLAILTMLFTLLAWSGSRAAILGFGLSYLLALVLYRRRLFRSIPIVVLAAGVGAVLSLQLAVPHTSYGLLNSLTETTSDTFDGSTGGRMTLWRGTLDLIAQRPIFGHGFDQFRWVYTGQPEGTIQPHNAILQLMVDFGVVGGLAALFVLLSFWWRAMATSLGADRTWALGPAMCLNALVVMALFDGAFYHADPLAVFAICFGILLSRPPAG